MPAYVAVLQLICFSIVNVSGIRDGDGGYRHAIHLDVKSFIVHKESNSTQLAELAQGWDLRKKIEAKALKYLAEDHIEIRGPLESRGIPGHVEIRLCSRGDNKRFSEKTFSVAEKNWVNELEQEFQDRDMNSYVVYGQDGQCLYSNGQCLDVTSLMGAARKGMANLSSSQFPLALVAVGRTPFTVECASTVTNGETIGLALHNVQMCLQVDFHRVDLDSKIKGVSLDGTMHIRVTMPNARLGFQQDTDGSMKGFFNEGDAKLWRKELLKWTNADSHGFNSGDRGNLGDRGKAAFGGLILMLTTWLDKAGSATNEIFQKLMDYFEVFPMVAQTIASTVNEYSSTKGLATLHRMLSAQKAQRAMSGFAWFTGYGAGSCVPPRGSVNEIDGTIEGSERI